MSANPEQILMVRLSSVGDVLLATPVAAWLKHRYPQARLRWLVDAGYEDLVTHNPHVDEVVSFDYTGRHRGPSGIRRLAAELKPVDFMVDLQHKLRTGLLARRLKPTRRKVLVKRRGMDLVRAMMGRDTIFRGPHQVERYFAILEQDVADPSLPAPLMKVAHERLTQMRQGLTDRLGSGPLVGLVVGAKHATKCWPRARYLELAKLCLAQDLGLVLLGGIDDLVAVETLAAQLPGDRVVVRAGGSLMDLACNLAACRAVVSPDSGPGHMAGALGVGLVSLFGPTSPERWSPQGSRVEVVRLPLACSPCSNHGGSTCPVGTLECMRSLSAELVFEALDRVLELSAGMNG